MRLLEGEVIASASDLNDFLTCPHRSGLVLRALRRDEPRPPDDPTFAVIARKGEEHERAALLRFEAEGRAVTRIAPGDGSARAALDAVVATREAMQRGDDVIYQAAFEDRGWAGRPDFLVRVEVPSSVGLWSYDVADAKLAVREKAVFLVQLCVYARLVESVQGRLPAAVIALLGDGRRISYDPARFVPYVDAARERFISALPSLDPDAISDKIGACAQCAWNDRCEAGRREVDHLSFVAGIRRSQIVRLADAGITTLAQLARAPQTAPGGMGGDAFTALRRQAMLQEAARSTGGAPSYELLGPRENAGFALLPAPHPHDVYFDMEGDPLYEPGTGLEYLFGAYVHHDGAYVKFWGETRAEERRAFERFVDWLVDHRRAHPGAHVYHYAPYEKTALRKLAQRHGSREDEVDELLRSDALVDLYAVVRGAVAQSHESYSIKKLERFYGFTRSADVRKGDDSIVVFEQYLLDRDPARRESIIVYNREDCVSTFELHRWLLQLRAEAVKHKEVLDAWRAPRAEPETAPAATAERAEVARLAALLEVAPDGDPRRLLAHLLNYHRREDKPVWWRFFDRCDNAAETDFVGADHETIGGLVRSTAHAPFTPKGGRLPVYTYGFPRQHHKVKPGTYRDPHHGQHGSGFTYAVVAVDDDALLVQIKHHDDAPPPRALCEHGSLPTDAQRAALRRFAQALIDGEAAADFPAAHALLCKEAPRIRGIGSGGRIQPDEREGVIDPADVASLALRLVDGVLPVQGPPGTGKTYTGARVIAALLAAGKRIGVTAPSHRAIHNLLHEIEEVAAQNGSTFRGVKKGGEGEGTFVSRRRVPFIEQSDKKGTFEDYALVAGTSWFIAREDLAQLDVLVIDEAGQVSLADALAMATKARSVILLGDPSQLAQVSLGTHPEGAGVSVLEHLLDGAPTVPPDRGVFLERSFRMHPSICAFISAMVYEHRLASAAGTDRQRVDAPAFNGAGLRYVPVEHHGEATSSPAEADAVADIVAGLLGGRFTARNGEQRTIEHDDILIVSPYNAQVELLRRTLRARFGGEPRVGTVDKFQGQEAAVVIYSLAASSAEDAPRGPDFLLEENRFNVAVSRGRALSILVCSPQLLATSCTSVEQLRAVASFCAFAQEATTEAAVPV